MSWDEWGQRDALALAELIRTGEVTAHELVAQAAAAAVRLEPELHATLEIFDDTLENAEVDAPAKNGSLYGVPMLLKDPGPALKGRKRESGSKLFRGEIAASTDPVVENCLNAGLIPLGRTTAPEMAIALDTSFAYRGEAVSTRNPWNVDRTPGGSSGGSAAAVAAAIVPVATATDGGGSTRIPASFTGLIGLKASRGRVPKDLLVSEYSDRLSVDGVLTRSVRDTAALLDILAQTPLGGAFIPIGSPAEKYSIAALRDPGKLRIGLSAGMWGRDHPADREVTECVRRFASMLEDLGHIVQEVEDSQICDFDALWEGYNITCISGRAKLNDVAVKRGIDPTHLGKYLTPIVHGCYIASEKYDKFDLWHTMTLNDVVMRGVGRLMSKCDLLLTPTAAIRVPRANGPYSPLSDEAFLPWWERMCDACRYTMMGNEAGLPGISLPAGTDSEGLPIGAQLYATWGREDLLLQVATQVERSKPEWFQATPRVHA